MQTLAKTWLRYQYRVYRYGTNFLVLLLELYCAWRFYYKFNPDSIYTPEFIQHVIVIVLIDFLLFWAHCRASTMDPGWQLKNPAKKGEEGHCKKCGARKHSDKVHHCKRCDHCVDHMDHHCFFTDNCVSKKTYKSFVLFCIYVMILCIYGTFYQIYFMYTKNVETGEGIMGMVDYALVAPYCLQVIWIADTIPFVEVKSYIRVFDYYCLMISVGFFAISNVMFWSLMRNLKKSQSLVDKVKGNSASTTEMSPAQVFEIVFNEPPSLKIKHFFPV